MNKKFVKYIEIIFNCLYLLTVFILGLLLIFQTDSLKQSWGIMALLLGIGDSFHLLPRIGLIFIKESNSLYKMAGYGKMITSITMTIFYGFLWFLGLKIFEVEALQWTIVLSVLSLIRIILCLLPQNVWTKKDAFNRFAIFRNIPFFLIGIQTMLFYFIYGMNLHATRFMGVFILLSFIFYLPVVLWSHKNKKIGMLMLPKSICYVLIIILGFYCEYTS